MARFCLFLINRYVHHLSATQKAEVEGWERELCVTGTEVVGKFLEMLERRGADLKELGAISVDQLFSGHKKKCDADLRFGYDFIRRSWKRLSQAQQQRVRQALKPFVHAVEQMPAKSVHDSKLFEGETVLGDELPRPWLPKVCGNCMATAWMQNRASCHFFIVSTKWILTC